MNKSGRLYCFRKTCRARAAQSSFGPRLQQAVEKLFPGHVMIASIASERETESDNEQKRKVESEGQQESVKKEKKGKKEGKSGWLKNLPPVNPLDDQVEAVH